MDSASSVVVGDDDTWEMMMNSNRISVIIEVLALWGIVPEADTVKKPVLKTVLKS